MPFYETKIYFDGSHYIGIPHTTRPSKPKREPSEEKPLTPVEVEVDELPFPTDVQLDITKNTTTEIVSEKAIPKEVSEKDTLLEKERKKRNAICRRVRCVRKANLQEFNYFVTFTYNGAIHTEASFRRKLRYKLANLTVREAWKYIGVWERSPEKKRLHFHGIFHVPEGTMPGKIIDVEDYSFVTHKRQITKQNTYFNEYFGRSDFEPINDRTRLGDALAYILKYIEKTGERIVYSKNLPQFFICDVMEEDIVCRIGIEDRKLLLFDDFECWEEGEFKGIVSKDTIKSLRTEN